MKPRDDESENVLASPGASGEVGPESLRDLFEAHYKRMFRAACRVTGSASDAEDVLQTVFLRLARRNAPVVLGDTAGSYLHRAAVNAALDLLRSRGRAGAVELEEADADPVAAVDSQPAGPERRFAHRELCGLVRGALRAVNPRAAEMFVLRYIEGYGNSEIAEMLGTSGSSVAVTLHRTRNRLKESLGSAIGVQA